LTLLAVHAHPDDEATSTGGILAKYSAEGLRSVVVTCTNGECGDMPDGTKPGEPGHDPDAVVALRRAELERSCTILGVTHLELLGFRDSGMVGWPANEAPDSFWRTPVPVAAARLVPLLERYRPEVVVTYGPDGFYGHPDHIQAHRVTLAALDVVASRSRLFFPVIPASGWKRFVEMRREAGEDASEVAPPEFPSMHWPDDELAAVLDCRAYAKTAYDALLAHQSQVQNFAMVSDGSERFGELFGTQAFTWGRDDVPSPAGDQVLDDLFARADAR
jgi:LmbE family N-acetylglucosaminyl deacetylase